MAALLRLLVAGAQQAQQGGIVYYLCCRTRRSVSNPLPALVARDGEAHDSTFFCSFTIAMPSLPAPVEVGTGAPTERSSSWRSWGMSVSSFSGLPVTSQRTTSSLMAP